MDAHSINEHSVTQPYSTMRCWWYHPGRANSRYKPGEKGEWCGHAAMLYEVIRGKEHNRCRGHSVRMWLCLKHVKGMEAAGYIVTKVTGTKE